MAVQFPLAEELACSEVEPRRDPWLPLPPNDPKPPLPVRKGGRGTTIGSGGRNCCRCLACGSSSCNMLLPSDDQFLPCFPAPARHSVYLVCLEVLG